MIFLGIVLVRSGYTWNFALHGFGGSLSWDDNAGLAQKSPASPRVAENFIEGFFVGEAFPFDVFRREHAVVGDYHAVRQGARVAGGKCFWAP